MEHCFLVEEKSDTVTVRKLVNDSIIAWKRTASTQLPFDWMESMDNTDLWEMKRYNSGIPFLEEKTTKEDRWDTYRRTISRTVQGGYEDGIVEIEETGTFADWSTRKGWSM